MSELKSVALIRVWICWGYAYGLAICCSLSYHCLLSLSVSLFLSFYVQSVKNQHF